MFGADELKVHVEVFSIIDEARVTLVHDVVRPVGGFDLLVNDTVPMKPFIPVMKMLSV